LPSHVSPRHAVTAAVFVLLALLSIALGRIASPALANTPACQNISHNTASGQGWPCSNGPDGLKYNMLCTGNLRQAPYYPANVHGTAIGSGINHYKSVGNGPLVQGNCGGPTTNLWYLSSNGWVSRSITTLAQ
jgi:hypothetical protein